MKLFSPAARRAAIWASNLGLVALLLNTAPGRAADAEAYLSWEAVDFAIPEPLGGLAGDPERGRVLAATREKGNCLACHSLPIPEEPDHGNLGPPLDGVGARLTPGQMRLRLVDGTYLNPYTIMPGYYRDPALLHRVAPALAGRTVLSAQEIEDVLAYLVTLK
jgi:sulfur-oxidizing protein SoxX